MDGERELLVGKWGHMRLGFALLLKFFQREGFFPSGGDLFRSEVVDFVAGHLTVPAEVVDRYAWSGRTNAYHRRDVRVFLGLRECSSDDAERLTVWLAKEVATSERSSDRIGERSWPGRYVGVGDGIDVSGTIEVDHGSGTRQRQLEGLCRTSSATRKSVK